jgi:hypothetical protein
MNSNERCLYQLAHAAQTSQHIHSTIPRLPLELSVSKRQIAPPPPPPPPPPPSASSDAAEFSDDAPSLERGLALSLLPSAASTVSADRSSSSLAWLGLSSTFLRHSYTWEGRGREERRQAGREREGGKEAGSQLTTKYSI